MFKLIVLIILLLYAGLLLYGAFGFLRGKIFRPATNSINNTTVCIIICARNEEKYIERCIQSVLDQDFDKHLMEIIVVDDASEDNTAAIAKRLLETSGLEHTIISNPAKAGKKASLTKAIETCRSELIITRDADTYTLSKDWLKTIVSLYRESHSQFIISPVEVEQQSGVLSQLQRFENAALAIITGGYALEKRAFLCNGANLAFTKKLFKQVEGYKAHAHIPSGDDVLFLEEIKKKFPQTIAYLKSREAMVLTYPIHGIKSLLSQKLRWMQKTNANPNPLNMLMGLVVLLTHILTAFFIIKTAFVCRIGVLGIIFISVRFFIDFLLLFLGSGYFNKPVKWLWFLPLGAIYSVYVIIITVLSLFVKPNWK